MGSVHYDIQRCVSIARNLIGYVMVQNEAMVDGLPTHLSFQVLIDAVVEIRFNAKQGVADLLPGLLHSLFPEKPRVERLPLADVPHQVRMMQPEFSNQPIVRLIWSTHTIFIGDGVLGVASGLPYQGWAKFREIISAVGNFSVIQDIIGVPNRISVKYVDFLPDHRFPGLENKLNWHVSVADEVINGSQIALRSERETHEYICFMEVLSPAQIEVVEGNMGRESGTLVSFDLIKLLPNVPSWEVFLEIFHSQVDFLHLECKKKFFACLSEGAKKILMPEQ